MRYEVNLSMVCPNCSMEMVAGSIEWIGHQADDPIMVSLNDFEQLAFACSRCNASYITSSDAEDMVMCIEQGELEWEENDE